MNIYLFFYSPSASLSPELIIISFIFAFMGFSLHHIIYLIALYLIYDGANFNAHCSFIASQLTNFSFEFQNICTKTNHF